MPKELPSDWLTPAFKLEDEDYGDILQEGKITEEDARMDWTADLGDCELTMREEQVYRFLLAHGGSFTSTEDIYREIWGDPDPRIKTKNDYAAAVSVTVCRIRKKLGEASILNEPEKGYVTQRGRINDMVGKKK